MLLTARRNPPIMLSRWHAESHSIPRGLVVVTGGTEMKLCDLCTIRVDFPEANFWIVRRGSESRCGEPTRVYNPEHIGVRVERTDILLPDYLFYVFVAIHNTGYWRQQVTGSTNLVNIKVSAVRNIELSPT